MASTSRVAQTPPPPADVGKPDLAAALPAGGGSSSHAAIVPDGQMTIISSRPPLPVQPLADGVSDSAARILQGKILPGDRLGHFELVQYIGGGGMGRVFRALDTRLARTVAVKVLSPDQAADHDTLLRFQNEAQSAARLDHDNIARVHYVGEDRGLHYIVFEFIAGVNIRELVEAKGPLPLAEAISYTLQAAEALAHAAHRNVVHRDIKPSNLLITPEGQVKLIDMGLARLREVGGPAADLTASGITLGTFDYISPEQARDPRNADVRSDLYSLGCTFFYMLTGRPPFPGGTVLQKLLQHQGDQPPDVRQFRPELPEGVTRVLRRTLAKDPATVYADPGEMVGDILLLVHEAGIGLRTLPGKTWTVPRRPVATLLRRHLPWAAPLAALGLSVLLLDLFWKPPKSEESLPPLPVVERGETPAGVPANGKQPVSAGPRDAASPAGTERPARQPAGPRSSAEHGLAEAGPEPPPPAWRRLGTWLDRLGQFAAGLAAGRCGDRRDAVKSLGVDGARDRPIARRKWGQSLVERRRAWRAAVAVRSGRRSRRRLRRAVERGDGPGLQPAGDWGGLRRPAQAYGNIDRRWSRRGWRVFLAGGGLQRGGQRRRDRVAVRRPPRGKAHPAGQSAGDDPRRRGLSARDRLPAQRPRSGQVSAQHDHGLRRAADVDEPRHGVAGSPRGGGRQLVVGGDAGRPGGAVGEVHAVDRQRLCATGGVSPGRGLLPRQGGPGSRHCGGRRAAASAAAAAGVDLVDCIACGEAVFLPRKTSSRSASPGTTACWPPASGYCRPAAARGRCQPARPSSWIYGT